MKLRLSVINIAVPLVSFVSLGFLPQSQTPLPSYVLLGLILFTLGRAFLLLLQQTIFSVLPILILVLPESWRLAVGFDIHAPYVMHSVLLYLLVVNFQWGQRPWLHNFHWINLCLLVLIAILGCQLVAIPKAFLVYQNESLFWPGLLMIIMVLGFSIYWGRLGRWAAFWPLLGMWTYSINWAPDHYILLWICLATLLTLTVDSYMMAFVDELTGVPGRRAMEFKLKTMGKNYFLAMADVDHFKSFNDTHGHQVGDDVLKMVAHVLSKTSKGTAYRYGGEEFVLLFSNTDSEDVNRYLEATREALEQYDLYPKSALREKARRGKGTKMKPLHITASFGVARQKGSEPYHEVISRADKALYKAKSKGRNRIEGSK